MQLEGVLEEKDFIHEAYGKNPFLFWKGFLLAVSLTCLVLIASGAYFHMLGNQFANNPFLQVTNRQLSLFLWQNPQHMRIHVKQKNGYLPAFSYAEKIGMNPEYAEDYAIAPPELLFQYHTWKRLLADYEFPRKATPSEFMLFLSAAPEWSPRYWSAAPESYMALVDTLSIESKEDLYPHLPFEVRQAFVGWKNYFFEGDAINTLKPSTETLQQFLEKYPQFGRSYWCNLFGDSYLLDENKLSCFLRVALFNDAQSLK